MIVTEIRLTAKNKYEIYIDQEFAFVLYKGELRKYGIKEKEVISDATYQLLVEEVLKKRATLRAMNLLTKRPYTEFKLKQKLMHGKYPESCIEHAITYVKSYGYIDDESYARDYIAYHIQKDSKRSIEQKLLQKGISADIINKSLAEYDDGEQKEIEGEQIRQLVLKKYREGIPTDPKERNKMLNFLMRKGYNLSDIRSALREINLDDLYNLNE